MQTKPWRREENTLNNTSHMAARKPVKVKQSRLFPSEMIAKQEGH